MEKKREIWYNKNTCAMEDKNLKKLDVTEYIIETDKFKKNFTGFKFVMLSDLHSNVYNINLHDVNDIIKAEHPDAVLIAGDMFNSKKK